MVRTLFLLLVLVGALAAIVGVIVGFGLVQVGALGSDPTDVAVAAAPASAPSPAGNAASPPPSTAPATLPATVPAAPVVAAAPPAVVAKPPPPAQPVVAAVPLPAAPVVLRGAEAKLHGPNIRVLVPEGDVGFWETREDFVSWVVTPPPGVYHVDVVYSGGAESGG
ncbi:MAG TPA: hypothetical protein VF796_14085, partial [Humisphaera sp.]